MPAPSATAPAAHHRSGTGSPLVLLHGLTGSWRAWSPVLDALAEHHDVFAPTIPGHHGGAAIADGAEVSVASLADGLERVLDDAGVREAHLVGNSLGGWLALELARRGRATSVVALSPAGGWRTRRDLRRVTRLISTSAAMGVRTRPYVGGVMRFPAARRWALRQTMERGDRVPLSVLSDLLDDLAGCDVVEEFLLATRRDGPFAGDMAHVSAPIRIAWGASDRTIPFDRYGMPIVERVPAAEVVMVPGVGHVPMFDDPALVARTILEVTTAVEARA